MKKSLAVVCSILIFASVFFSSCTSPFNSAENLIAPPRLTGDNALLQTAFENAVMDKGEITLKTPAAGSYRSAFCLDDYDSDGEDEAVVFYSLKEDENTVYMNILDKIDGEWTSINDIKGDGSSVESVDFIDLNNDNVCEILVSYSILDSKSNKRLSVYSNLKNGSDGFTFLAMEPYTQMYFTDIDSDGYSEIALAYLDSTAEQYTSDLTFLKMNSEKGTIYSFAKTTLYSENTGFAGITSDVKDGICYLYIDEIASGSYVTEIVYWDSNSQSLIKPVDVDILTLRNCPTARILSVTCSDINGDGYIEIPTAKHLNDSKVTSRYNESLNQQINLITWYSYTGKAQEFEKVKEYIRNSTDGYTIQLSDDIINSVSAVFDADNHSALFYYINSDSEKTKLFSVNAVLISDSASYTDGVYLKSGSIYSYYCTLFDESEQYNIDLETIKSALQIADEY